jgi:hypothetical protein
LFGLVCAFAGAKATQINKRKKAPTMFLVMIQ